MQLVPEQESLLMGWLGFTDNPLCDHQKKHMLHCCHVLAFFRDMGKLEWDVYVKEYVPSFMTIEAYIEAYSNVFIYPILKGDLKPRVFFGPMPKPLPPTPAAAPSSKSVQASGVDDQIADKNIDGGDGEGGEDKDDNAGKDEDDNGNDFEAAFNATMPVDDPVETASKKPTSTKGSRNAKVTKATPAPVPPHLAFTTYGAPTILPPPVPDKRPGRPRTKRIKNKGSSPSDGGTTFKLKPGNKEEPLVDARARKKRTTAGTSTKYGNMYYKR